MNIIQYYWIIVENKIKSCGNYRLIHAECYYEVCNTWFNTGNYNLTFTMIGEFNDLKCMTNKISNCSDIETKLKRTLFTFETTNKNTWIWKM